MSKANLKIDEENDDTRSSKEIIPKYFNLSEKAHELNFEIMYWAAFTGQKEMVEALIY